MNNEAGLYDQAALIQQVKALEERVTKMHTDERVATLERQLADLKEKMKEMKGMIDELDKRTYGCLRR